MKLFSHCDWFNHIYFQQRDIILSLPLYFIYVNLAHYLLLNISSRWVFYLHFLLLILELLKCNSWFIISLYAPEDQHMQSLN